MIFKNTVAVGLISLCAFSQNAWAELERVGACPGSIIQGKPPILVNATLLSPDLGASDPGGSVFCKYANKQGENILKQITFPIDQKYEFTTCIFRESGKNICEPQSEEECTVWCEPKKK